jgi:hypothetical protein
MRGKNGRVGRHNQECTSRWSFHVAAETEDETRDKIYNARGERMVHVLQIDDYRNSMTIILANGDGILKIRGRTIAIWIPLPMESWPFGSSLSFWAS